MIIRDSIFPLQPHFLTSQPIHFLFLSRCTSQSRYKAPGLSRASHPFHTFFLNCTNVICYNSLDSKVQLFGLESVSDLKFFFFDTSAICRMVLVKEPGADKVKELTEHLDNKIFTSWILIAESLGVLKRKLKNCELSEKEY